MCRVRVESTVSDTEPRGTAHRPPLRGGVTSRRTLLKRVTGLAAVAAWTAACDGDTGPAAGPTGSGGPTGPQSHGSPSRPTLGGSGATRPPGTAIPWNAATAWPAATHDTLRRHVSGAACQNYNDPAPTDWRTAYYGANAPRLAVVRRKYDPDRFFAFPQAL